MITINLIQIELTDVLTTCRCVARNAVTSKERRSGVAKLTVVEPPADRWRPLSMASPPPPPLLWALQGSNVTLECAANGHPHPVALWSLNGVGLGSGSGGGGGAVVARPGYLRLTAVDRSINSIPINYIEID